MDKELLEAALAARERAYAPYSKFLVGAAVRAESGKIYTGCNIENAAYSPTNCAERTAFYKAVSEGQRNFKAIAIAGGKEELTTCYPCGVCRQVMSEFCLPDQFDVVCGVSGEAFEIIKLEELLPKSFQL